MVVTVVNVAHVRMRVHDRNVAVRVAVGLGRIDPGRMLVVMVLVVDVPMVVRERLVRMEMNVAITDEQHHTARHERGGTQVGQGPGLAQQRDREQRAGEGCRREHRGLSGRTERSQRVRVEDDAHPVRKRADRERARQHFQRRQRVAAGERQGDVHHVPPRRF